MAMRYALGNNPHSHEEESYFVSMTDMMVGLLFIFIIMLMYFALQYQSTTKQMISAQETRKAIVSEIQDTLRKEGLVVDVDPKSEVLRLSENALHFDLGSSVVDAKADHVITSLSSVLSNILPCYSNEQTLHANVEKCAQRNQEQHWIEAIFIEGHTDNRPYMVAGQNRNLNLSTDRAANTYAAMVAKRPDLEDLKNPEGQALLSVSGYGDKRPLSPDSNATDEGRRANRRIDIRLIMATPQQDEAIREIKTEIK